MSQAVNCVIVTQLRITRKLLIIPQALSSVILSWRYMAPLVGENVSGSDLSQLQCYMTPLVGENVSGSDLS